MSPKLLRVEPESRHAEDTIGRCPQPLDLEDLVLVASMTHPYPHFEPRRQLHRINARRGSRKGLEVEEP
jgi:hypothetical protein